MRKQCFWGLVGGVAATAAFTLTMVVAPNSALAATLGPGTYKVTANLSMPGQYNPVLTGVTVYATNPNNPFGPTIDENSGLSVYGSVPTTPVSDNATLVVGSDESYTLLVPTANPIFTLQDLGTNTSGLTDVKTERVTATKLLGNTAAWEGNYNQRDSRVHKVEATVADSDKAEGTMTYDFKGSEMYAVPLNMSLKPSGDIALQLTVDYDSAQKTSDSTDVPALETSRVVVNVPQSAKLEDTGSEQTGVFANKGYELSGTVSAAKTGRYTAIATLKDGFVWADGTTDPKTISWTIGDVPNVQADAPTAQTGLSYTGQEQTGVAAGEGYELSGDAKATNAGTYTATATLKDGYEWKDGSTEPKTITWTIDKVELKASAVLIQKYDNVHLPTADEVLSALEFSGFVNGETAETATGYVAPTYLGLKVNMMSSSPYLEDYMKTHPNYELVANTYYFFWFQKDTGGFDNYTLSFAWNDPINGTNGRAHHWSNRLYTTMTPEQEPRAVEGLVENGSRLNGIVDGTGNYYSRSNAWSLTSEYYDGAGNVGDNQYQTEAGTYTTVVKANTGHFWSDGTYDYRRITWAIASQITKVDEPTPVTGLSYTGQEQTGVAAGEGYELSGDAKATNAGTYTATATLKDGYTWQDGTTDAKQVSWSIAKAQLTVTYAGESITYGETPKLQLDYAGFKGADNEQSADGFVAPTVSAPQDVEVNRTYELTPAGGDGGTNYELSYESGTLTVTAKGTASVPTAKTGLVYSGSEQQGVTGATGVALTGAVAANAGDYSAIATLEPGYTWQDGTTDAKQVSWSIAKAQLTARYAGESIAYGSTPAGTVEVGGFVGGEDASSADGYVAPSVEVPTLEAGKSYTLMPAGGEAKNYEFMYEPGVLTVAAAPAPNPDPTPNPDPAPSPDPTPNPDPAPSSDDRDSNNNGGNGASGDGQNSKAAADKAATTSAGKRSVPATGDPAGFAGIIASVGGVLAAAGALVKRGRR